MTFILARYNVELSCRPVDFASLSISETLTAVPSGTTAISSNDLSSTPHSYTCPHTEMCLPLVEESGTMAAPPEQGRLVAHPTLPIVPELRSPTPWIRLSPYEALLSRAWRALGQACPLVPARTGVATVRVLHRVRGIFIAPPARRVGSWRVPLRSGLCSPGNRARRRTSSSGQPGCHTCQSGIVRRLPRAPARA